jgi:hypothetical protein
MLLQAVQDKLHYSLLVELKKNLELFMFYRCTTD